MNSCLSTKKAERGVALIITLFVLVVMTLASVAIVRTLDTSSLAVASHSFRSSGKAMGADLVEAAVQSLINLSNDKNTLPQLNQNTSINLGGTTGQYVARVFDNESPEGIPQSLQQTPSWQGLQDPDSGNTAYVLIERMCNAAGPAARDRCVVGYLGDGYSDTIHGDKRPDRRVLFTGERSIKILYRVTVRVEGPNNTVSFTQGVVNLLGSRT